MKLFIKANAVATLGKQQQWRRLKDLGQAAAITATLLVLLSQIVFRAIDVSRVVNK